MEVVFERDGRGRGEGEEYMRRVFVQGVSTEVRKLVVLMIL